MTDLIATGRLEEITSRLGEYLQLRPKGVNAKALTWGIDSQGERVKTLPRGYYLRAVFTKQIINGV